MPPAPPRDPIDTFRDRLEELVVADGRSIAALARAASINRVFLHQILSGYRGNPSVATVSKLLRALGARWGDLDDPGTTRPLG